MATNYKVYQFKDTENALTYSGSVVWPINAHLQWYDATYGFYFVNKDDQTQLLKTTDKGATACTEVTNQTKKIQQGRIIGTKLWLILCDNPDNEFEVKYIDLADSDNVVSVDDNSGDADANSQYAFDIFTGASASDIYALVFQEESGTDKLVVYKIDTAPIGKDGSTNTSVNVHEIILGDSDGFYIFLFKNSGGNMQVESYETTGSSFGNWDTIAGYSVPSDYNQRSSYAGSYLWFLLTKDADGKEYLMKYDFAGDTISTNEELNVILQRGRTNAGTNPNEVPFAFDITKDANNDSKVYKFKTEDPYLYFYTQINKNANIASINDELLVFQTDGTVYEFDDVLSYFTRFKVFHAKEGIPFAECEYRSDKITIPENVFVQVIGTYSANGSSTANSVVFEGIAGISTGTKLAKVKIINQAIESEQIEPSGTKSGRTDQHISDILDDGNNTYITEGTLAEGTAMGDITYQGNKTEDKIFKQLKDNDGFTFYYKPQGALDYNNGAVDTGVDLEFEAGIDNNAIWDVDSVGVYNINKVIVNGALGVTPGEWNDAEDQQARGVKKLIVHDASLDTNAKCDTKATAIGTRDSTAVVTAVCKFRKTSAGFIQPGQQITFKYVSENITVSSGQYTVDKLVMDILTEVGFLQVSSGLIFDYGKREDQLPEENSQKIEQVQNNVDAKIGSLVEDTSPQLGGDLDLNSHNIDFPSTANVSDCLDEDNMASDSATALATQQSIKAYADTKLANVVEDTTPQLGGDLDLNSHNIDFPSTANVSDCLDEDNMASDSATALATQQSIKAYVDNFLSGLTDYEMVQIRGAPIGTYDGDSIYLDAASEYVWAHFMVTPKVDAGNDVIFHFIYTSHTSTASVNIIKYARAIMTDQSEALSWNISNAAADTIDGSPTNKPNHKSITIDASDIASMDEITVGIQWNDPGDKLRFYLCYIEYVRA